MILKQPSIYLMGIHRFYYILIGAMFAILIYMQSNSVLQMLPFTNINPLYFILPIFGFAYLKVIAVHALYSDEEIQINELSENIVMFGGYVQKDTYFASKMNSDISLCKQIYGFIYSLFRAIQYLLSSYLTVAIIILLATK